MIIRRRLRIGRVARKTLHRRSVVDRCGAVTVEFALCAVVFFMSVFTMLEFSRYVFVRHSVQMVAYEAARVGIIPGATAQHVTNRAQALLDASGVAVASVEITPNVINNATQQVSVTVSCNFADNSWLPPTFLVGKTISTTVTLEHENKAFLNQEGVDISDVIGDNDDEPIDT